VTLPNSIPV